MPDYRAIAFDYDGTLFDTRPAIIHCIGRTFVLADLPPPPHGAILETVERGLALQETFVILDESLRRTPALLEERIRSYRALYAGESAPLIRSFPGVHEALRQIHDSGKKCLIVSNKGVAAIRQSLDDNSLTPFVGLLLGDEPGMPRKPDTAVLTQRILPLFPGLQSRQILMVGDTETDIQFAKSSDMPCCWVSYGFGDAARCRALTPEHEISSIGELPPLVTGDH